jgi:hypothetical protein
MSRLPGRLAALLLVAAAALRGAAPAIDAFAHHRGAEAETSPIHLDKPGGCGAHAEHCVLRGQTSGLRFTPPSVAHRVEPLLVSQRIAQPEAMSPVLQPSNYHQSRAPPLTSV